MFASIHCMMRMKRMNACSYALTWVDVGFNMKVSAAVFFSKYSFQRISDPEKRTSRAFLNRFTSHKSSRLCLQQSIKCKSVDSCRWSLCSYLFLWSCLMSVVSWVVCSCVGLPSYMLMVCVRRAMPPETLWVFVVQYEMKRHMCDKDMFYVEVRLEGNRNGRFRSQF